MEFLNNTYYGNSIKSWLIALTITIVSYLVLQIIKRFVSKRITRWVKKTQTDIDDLITRLLAQTKSFFLLAISIYGGTIILDLPENVLEIIQILIMAIILFQVGFWGNGLISYFVRNKAKKELELEKDAADATTIEAFGIVFKIALWVIITLLILDNAGVEVNSLVASLGISGIAVALAVQNILGDLFSSLSIALDKPFVIGDFIIVDDYMGTVEHIGLKSTRVRSLSGEQLVFSNSDLLGSRIRNYKRMSRRRVVFSIGITYQTPHQKAEAIPEMIKEIIEKQKSATFDRSHFIEFGDSSLNYETVYYVETPDHNTYMDIQQSINLTIYDRFEEEGIEFAYPTQTLFIEK
ncbi:MAG: mechanosensitive ion channel family protein [Anaerolineales bacterium]|jgi:small-conductance mechanosensitive channel